MRKLILFGLALLLTVNQLSGELIFNTQEFKPFSYQENENNLGAGVEIVKAVCKKPGWIIN